MLLKISNDELNPKSSINEKALINGNQSTNIKGKMSIV
jgi:hypothetical protein